MSKPSMLEQLQYMQELRVKNQYIRLDETATKIEYLTGYSLDQLLEKFASGWTLEPPKEPYKFSDLLRDFGE